MRKTAKFKQERHTARVERKAEKRAQNAKRRGRTKPSYSLGIPVQPRTPAPRLRNNFGSLAQKLIGSKKK